MSYQHVLLHLAFLLILLSGGASAQIRKEPHNDDILKSEFSIKETILKNPIKFLVHTKELPEGIEFDVNKASPYIKRNTQTKIVVHGYFRTEAQIQKIAKEYLNASENNNIITFWWKFIHNLNYTTAAEVSDYVGNFILADGISKIGCNHGLQPKQVHLIGYHLGAHLVGKAARKLNLTMGRITGLDPSRKCFEVPCDGVIYPGLDKNNAKTVDVMHTNGKFQAVYNPIGTIDFYPNGGTFQPACDNQKDVRCNTIMSLKYFAESIKLNKNFYGLRCFSYDKFLNHECDGFETTIWSGTGKSDLPSGLFFFETKATPPFGLGRNGTNPA